MERFYRKPTLRLDLRLWWWRRPERSLPAWCQDGKIIKHLYNYILYILIYNVNKKNINVIHVIYILSIHLIIYIRYHKRTIQLKQHHLLQLKCLVSAKDVLAGYERPQKKLSCQVWSSVYVSHCFFRCPTSAAFINIRHKQLVGQHQLQSSNSSRCREKRRDRHYHCCWRHVSSGLNLLHPRKDVAEMVIVFCVSLIVPEDVMFAIKSGEHVYQESSFFVSPLSDPIVPESFMMVSSINVLV